MSEDKHLNDALTRLVSSALGSFLDANRGQSLTDTRCSEIYQVIFNTIADTFAASNVEIPNEAMNFIAQNFYDNVKINGTQELNPHIFTKRATVENMTTKTLAFLVVAFRGSDLANQCAHEIKRRS